MLKKLKSYASQNTALCWKLKEEIENIRKEGRSDTWTHQKINEAIEAARRVNNDLLLEMKMAAAAEQNEVKENYLETWQGDNKGLSSGGAEKQQWRSLAQNCFNGRSPEDAIKMYEKQVGNMRQVDRKYRYIFDQELEIACYGDPVIEHQVGKTIDKYRTQAEKEAKRDYDMNVRASEYLDTLDAQFKMNLESAEKSETPLDATEVVNEIESNISKEFAVL